MSEICEIFRAYCDFLQPARFKVAYGGRGSAKTRTFITILLNNVIWHGWRLVCFREIMKSIEDSVYQEFIEEIERRNLHDMVDVLKTEIRAKRGTGIIKFDGLHRNQQKVKGYAGFDAAWVEEAAKVTKDSWKLLIPTLRKKGSEIWVSFNPESPLDDTYQRFVTNRKYPDAIKGKPYCIVRCINYDANPRFPEELRIDMELMKNDDPELYQHVYLGMPVANSALSIIKPSWIEAAIDAHLKLGISRTGNRFCGLDPMDEGEDFNARCYRDGQIVYQLDEWKDRDPVAVGERVYAEAIQDGISHVIYDNIGVGAGVKGKFREIETDMIAKGQHGQIVPFSEFTASESPCNPDSEYMPGRTNGQHFLNMKAMGWWYLRDRFHNTYKAVVEGKEVDMDNIISIDSSCITPELLNKLKGELSAPNREYSNGKIKVESKESLKKRGIPSHNLADSLVCAFSPQLNTGYNLSAW